MAYSVSPLPMKARMPSRRRKPANTPNNHGFSCDADDDVEDGANCDQEMSVMNVVVVYIVDVISPTSFILNEI